jgi:hypothetical protein
VNFRVLFSTFSTTATDDDCFSEHLEKKNICFATFVPSKCCQHTFFKGAQQNKRRMRFVFVDDLELDAVKAKDDTLASPSSPHEPVRYLAPAPAQTSSPPPSLTSPCLKTPSSPPQAKHVHTSPLASVPFLDKKRVLAALEADNPSLITMSVSPTAPQLHFLSTGRRGPVQRVQLDPNDAGKIVRISTYASPQHFLTIALPLLAKRWSVLQIHPFVAPTTTTTTTKTKTTTLQ